MDSVHFFGNIKRFSEKRNREYVIKTTVVGASKTNAADTHTSGPAAVARYNTHTYVFILSSFRRLGIFFSLHFYYHTVAKTKSARAR